MFKKLLTIFAFTLLVGSFALAKTITGYDTNDNFKPVQVEEGKYYKGISMFPNELLGGSCFFGAQGGTGICTASPSDVNKVLTLTSSSPLTYTLTTPSSGGGSSTNTSTAGYFSFYQGATSTTGTPYVKFLNGFLNITTNTVFSNVLVNGVNLDFTNVTSSKLIFTNATGTNLVVDNQVTLGLEGDPLPPGYRVYIAAGASSIALDSSQDIVLGDKRNTNNNTTFDVDDSQKSFFFSGNSPVLSFNDMGDGSALTITNGGGVLDFLYQGNTFIEMQSDLLRLPWPTLITTSSITSANITTANITTSTIISGNITTLNFNAGFGNSLTIGQSPVQFTVDINGNVTSSRLFDSGDGFFGTVSANSSTITVMNGRNLNISGTSTLATTTITRLSVATISQGALLLVQATSTQSLPFQVLDSVGNNLVSVASTSVTAFANSQGTATLTAPANVLTVGSELTSTIDIVAIKNNGGILIYDSSGIPNRPSAQYASNGFYLSNSGTATTTFFNNAFNYNRSTANADGLITFDSLGDVSASGTLHIYGSSILASTTVTGLNFQNATGTQVLVNTNGGYYLGTSSVSSTGEGLIDTNGTPLILIPAPTNMATSASYQYSLNEPPGFALAVVANYTATYSDDPDRILLYSNAAVGSIELKSNTMNANQTGAAFFTDYAGNAQFATNTTIFASDGGGNQMLIRGAITFKGIHYVIGVSTTIASYVIKHATSSWANNLSVAAAWPTSTVSGATPTSTWFIIGAYGNDIAIRTSTTGIMFFTVNAAGNLTFDFQTTFAGTNFSYYNARVNNNGCYLSTGAAPAFVHHYNCVTGAQIPDKQVYFSDPLISGPDFFAMPYSVYGQCVATYMCKFKW